MRVNIFLSLIVLVAQADTSPMGEKVAHNDIKIAKIGDGNDLYLLINGKSRLIPDDETASFMGFSLNATESISQSTFQQFQLGDPVESMIRKDNSPDEALRVYVSKFRTLQDNNKLIKQSVFIFHTSNPALVYWKGRYFSTSRGKEILVLGERFCSSRRLASMS